MKKLLVIILLLRAFAGQSQVNIDAGIGTDMHHAVSRLGIGYTLDRVVVEGVISPSLTRSVAANNYLGVSAGYTIINAVTPSLGYYYDHVSADKRYLNKAYAGYSVKATAGKLFANVLYIHTVIQVTAGIHVILN